MVTSREGVSDDISSGKLQQSENSVVGHDGPVSNQKGSPLSVLPAKQSSSTEQVASELTQENSTHPVIPEKVPNDLKPIQSPDDVIDASQSNQEGSSLSIVNDSDTRTSVSYQDGSSLSTIPKKELDNSNTGILTSENQDGKALTTVPENLPDTLLQNLDHGIMVHASQSDQEKSTLSRTPEKVLGKLPLRRNPDIGAPVLQSVQEGNTHFKIPEKPSEDGYNWRKYGQKLVRGNQFVRSYYKCTFPNCPAKKQVERSHEGNITNINCRGQHEHPKPQQSPQIAVPIQARKPDPPSIRSEDETSNVNHNDAPHHIVPVEALPPIETPKLLTSEAHVDAMEGAASESNKTRDKADRDGYPDPKRRKRDNSTMDDTLASANRTNGESRVVVQTTCLVDIVNDGYRWRKYGQKLVKGNANPRSYYRCSSTGCPVKKHVERASHDPKVVITTYEGQHDHEMPSSARTVTPNAPVTPSRSEPEEEKEAGPLDLVVHGTAN